MSKVTDLTGAQAQAQSFDLIMRKEFAKQIIDGVKKLEFRAVSDFYISRYMPENPDGSLDYKDEIEFLHFHDYNNSWFLDVHIEPIWFRYVHPACADFFHHYGHYEFDQDMEEFAHLDPDNDDESANIPSLFCIPIDAIVNTNLTPLDDIRKAGKVPVYTIAQCADKLSPRRHR